MTACEQDQDVRLTVCEQDQDAELCSLYSTTYYCCSFVVFFPDWMGAGRHLRRAARVDSHPVNTIQRATNGHLYLRVRPTARNLQRQNKTDQLSAQDCE